MTCNLGLLGRIRAPGAAFARVDTNYLVWQISGNLKRLEFFGGINGLAWMKAMIEPGHPERLWRSLKYECVFLNAFETGIEARAGIGRWIG